MMGMTDRDSQGICGVRSVNLDARKQSLNHHLNLILGGVTSPNDRFLYKVG